MACEVTIERRVPFVILRYANPPLGLISTKGAALLAGAVESTLKDDSIRAMIVTGAQEGIFVRHADVGQLVRAAEALQQRRIEAESFVTSPFARLTQLCDESPVPIIAAINGVCMGAGLEIALACTVRILDRSVASIGLPEIRLGIIPGGGGTQRLATLLGTHRARLFMLRGAVVGSQEALRIGLVDEIAANSVERAIEIANELAARSPSAVRAILSLTRAPQRQDGFRAEVLAFAELLQNDRVSLERMQRFVDDSEDLSSLSARI